MEQSQGVSAEALATLGDSVSWGEDDYRKTIGALHTQLAQLIDQAVTLRSARDQLYQLYVAVTAENEALKGHVSMLQSEIERLTAAQAEATEAELLQLLAAQPTPTPGGPQMLPVADEAPALPDGVTPIPIPEKRR